MTGGRPRRPVIEAQLVREAAAPYGAASPREPIARDLAARVVQHLRAFAAEASDPTLAALGQFGRAVMPCPTVILATDPEIDSLALFVEARVKSLRQRGGWSLRVEREKADINACFAVVQNKLTKRYLAILRS